MAQSNASGAGSRDSRLAGFAAGGCYDVGLPSAAVAGVLEAVGDGTGRPPPEATDDELVGMMSCWQSLEAHAHARLLAAMRELIRRRAKVGFGDYPGALPGAWETGTAHEVAAELGISWQAAVPLLHVAWELEARLPALGRLLEEGVLTGSKAGIVVEEFGVLSDDMAAEAEKTLLGHDLGSPEMTPGKLRKLCQKIADTVDPEGAQKRREETQREQARVAFFRAHGGDTRLFAEGLPADDALMAKASIQARALEYKAAGIYPDRSMDLLRVLSMLDLINEVPVEARVARFFGKDAASEEAWRQEQRAREEEAAEVLAKYGSAGGTGSGGDPPGKGSPAGNATGGSAPDDDGWASPADEDCSSREGGPVAGDGPDGGSGGGGPGKPGGPGGAFAKPRDPGLPSLVHLTLPLVTLMGLGRRPGEVPGYGSIDAGLVEDLAKAAADNPRTKYCFTVTDPEGRATGHACARLIREPRNGNRGTGTEGRDPGATGRAGPDPGADWELVLDPSRAGPEGGHGAWILTVPGGARYQLDIHPVPLHECDHRLATDAYRPGKLLRHLVEVRDGECSFTGCSHPASQSDFEHSVAWQRGGATDSCNASPMSRRCHRVKQSGGGWGVSQPEPGRHVWHTPSGRTYEKGAKSYPD